MKYNKYIILLTLILTGLVSCVDEAIIDNDESVWQEGDTPYYIHLRLNSLSENFTRASETALENFIDGELMENAISPNAGNIAIFFDKDDKYISWADLYSVTKTEGHEDALETSPSTEATYSCRFNGMADNKPAKVLVAVNLPAGIYKQITDFPGWTLKEVMKQVWNAPGTLDIDKYRKEGVAEYTDDPRNNLGFYTEGTGENKKYYFTMTNSTYVEGNLENLTNLKLHCAEPIPDTGDNFGKYITTNENAVKDLTPLPVYLERMVCKMQVSGIEFDPNYYLPAATQPLDVCTYEDGEFNYSEMQWGIQILGWGINGLETSNYLFKNVPYEKTESETLDWLNPISHPGWNSTYNRRCFWSEDPHYIKDVTKRIIYPWQFDDGKDKYDIDNKYYSYFQSYDNKDHISALTYYPFKQFCPEFDEVSGGTFEGEFNYVSKDASVYTPENTFKPRMIVDRSRGTRSYELAGTHLILCTRLLLPKTDGSGYTPYQNENLFRNRVGISYTDPISMFEDFMNAVNFKLRSSREMIFKYYPWGNTISSVKEPNKEDYFGRTIKAKTKGEYALYCYFPDFNASMELNSKVLQLLLDQPNEQYRLFREADAVNADGKVIPWIMYNEKKNGKDEDYKPLKIMVLLKNGDPDDDDKPLSEWDPKFGTGAEIIKGNPDDGDETEEYLRDRKLEFQKNTGGQWENYVTHERDDNDIQSLFYEIWGVADCFHHGLMYYAVPIYAQEVSGDPAIDYTAPWDPEANMEYESDETLQYYYGVVRNNWYKFSIKSIGDIGIPVMNPEKPIVPNYTAKKNQVKFEMTIKDWHLEEQNVEMPR